LDDGWIEGVRFEARLGYQSTTGWITEKKTFRTARRSNERKAYF
jgi:hypothetical protein